ncbi:sigma-54-dependent Fis family transcriptional regulator [[Mycobacterium] nativiensis]|uniref:Helix-turn-helix domain-containing protein n=1 Tax=[Mycobacterium] nativiensis TaxID=2855503 RepID=A0ABU5Y6N1_9MYCO|nr:helix-turn-helix domain-containing protein [Mycolicibacter sp. MYC340]MEB3034655.1 helix-turn-helix domain-containing protein [Mycolicibacter sp. MYC340]
MLGDGAPDLRVAAARLGFLEHGRSGVTGVSNLVVASWERSRAAGVDVSQPNSSFTDTFDTGSLLVSCAQPILDQLADDIADSPLVVALTDKTARLVQRVDCSAEVARMLDRVEFAPGFDYAESTMGTNGVGTVFEAGQPVSVVGPEHFTEKLQQFGCTGAPIIDPITGRVEGVLDISTPARSWNPLVRTLVKAAAKDISRNFLLDRSQDQQAIFDTYLRVAGRSARQAVFAFGHSVSIANPVAQQMFNADEQRVLYECATFFMTHRDSTSDSFPLPGRERLVHLRGTRVVVGSDVVGVVVVIDPLPGQRPGPPAAYPQQLLPRLRSATEPAAKVPVEPFSSPTWLRACDELRDALRERKPALVVGEPGVGKLTLVTELFHAEYPGARRIAVDAARFGSERPPPYVRTLLSNPNEPTLCVVRDPDQAGPDGAEPLEEFLSAVESLGEAAWLVGTVFSPVPDIPFGPWLDHFDTTITVPPLRYRTDDLPAVTAELLREIAPEHRVGLSPAAQRLISRYSWPGNLAQLREALVHALHRRPVGEIRESDLPGYCQTTSRRTLTPIETAERDAIVAALRDVNGNRVAAAMQLGMSRSSLYRKLKTYGITA